MKNNLAWYTFIELLIWVSVFAVLVVMSSTFYFESLFDSRDAIRKSEIEKIWVSLEQYKLHNMTYVTPERAVSVKESWNLISKQWVFWKNNATDINFNGEFLDTQTQDNYLYSTDAAWSKYLLVAFKEGKLDEWENVKYWKLWPDSRFPIVSWEHFYVFDYAWLPLESVLDLSSITPASTFVSLNEYGSFTWEDVKFSYAPKKSCEFAYRNWILKKSWYMLLRSEDGNEFYAECLVDAVSGAWTKLANIDAANKYHMRKIGYNVSQIYNNSKLYGKFSDAQINNLMTSELRLECAWNVNYFQTSAFDSEEISLDMYGKEDYLDTYESITRQTPNDKWLDWTKISWVTNWLTYWSNSWGLNWCSVNGSWWHSGSLWVK